MIAEMNNLSEKQLEFETRILKVFASHEDEWQLLSPHVEILSRFSEEIITINDRVYFK